MNIFLIPTYLFNILYLCNNLTNILCYCVKGIDVSGRFRSTGKKKSPNILFDICCINLNTATIVFNFSMVLQNKQMHLKLFLILKFSKKHNKRGIARQRIPLTSYLFSIVLLKSDINNRITTEFD